MNRIKVMEVIPMLNDGGAETLVVNYGLLMERENFEPIIVPIHTKTNTENYKRSKGKIKTVPVYKTNSFIKKVMYRLVGSWYVPLRLKQIIKKEKPDAIHIHLQLLAYFNPIAKHLKGIRVFYTCHNEPKYMFSPTRPKEEAAAKKLIESNALRIVALHEDMRQEINQRFGISDTVVIKNAVDFKKFRNVAESKGEIRKGLGIPEDAFVLGHIGRYTSQKNHEFLIDIFQAVVQKKPEAHLILIGTGEKYEEIEARVQQCGLENNVKMFRSRGDIPQIFKAIDVFVFPSLFEGLSVTMVEAQAAGVRCVVSDKINSASFLSPKTVALSLDDSCEDWANAVINNDLVTEKEYGDIDAFDLNKEIRRLEKMYEGVL